jgi:hypothetical protein
VVIHGYVGFDLDNLDGTDFSMAFYSVFLKLIHLSSVVENFKCKPLPGLGDHDIVLIDANIEATRSKTPKCKIFIWKLANGWEVNNLF